MSSRGAACDLRLERRRRNVHWRQGATVCRFLHRAATWGSTGMTKKPVGRKRPNVWESVDLRQEQHEAKRRLILKQAALLFADRGFHETTIDQIAEALNVTKPPRRGGLGVGKRIEVLKRTAYSQEALSLGTGVGNAGHDLVNDNMS